MTIKNENSKKVLIGISGGIATYKICSLVSKLVQNNFDVTVAMTHCATKFVCPLTFASLSGKKVITDPWEPDNLADPQHIRIAQNSEIMLVAPCSMNMISKLSNGDANDSVSLLASARSRPDMPTIIAPSMNSIMLNQPSTQRNLKQLENDNYIIIPPEIGWQACRTNGEGRLPEPEYLYDEILRILQKIPS